MGYYCGYVVLSTAMLVGFVIEAVNTHRQLYPSIAQLTNSKTFSLVILNESFALITLLGFVCSRVFFSRLSMLERQTAVDRFCMSLLETVFALAYFRSSMGLSAVRNITFCLFIQVFHTLASLRQESIEGSHRLPIGHTARLIALLSVLFYIDISGMLYFGNILKEEGLGIEFMFLLECAVGTLKASEVIMKLIIHLYGQQLATGGHGVAVINTYRFYLNLVVIIVRCVIYVVFFAVMCSLVHMPIHLFRQLIVNVGAVLSAIRNFARYRRLGLNIDKSFPDATSEQLDRDRTCSICYEEMENNSHCKALSCQHVFHRQCLQRWFEKSVMCPYCNKKLNTEGNNGQVLVPENAAPAPAEVVDGGPPPAVDVPGASATSIDRQRVAVRDHAVAVFARQIFAAQVENELNIVQEADAAYEEYLMQFNQQVQGDISIKSTDIREMDSDTGTSLPFAQSSTSQYSVSIRELRANRFARNNVNPPAAAVADVVTNISSVEERHAPDTIHSLRESKGAEEQIRAALDAFDLYVDKTEAATAELKKRLAEIRAETTRGKR
eukprot:Tbor_TRINITY_DN4988_c0_g1::TRINITY_DN4988_c0_g1_i2::g.9654::m.9654/K10601/SYVN1, HRD1; E3 ubiquitin-protein ligase synoviolin